jgi:hypothetical protein
LPTRKQNIEERTWKISAGLTVGPTAVQLSNLVAYDNVRMSDVMGNSSHTYKSLIAIAYINFSYYFIIFQISQAIL